MPVLKEVQQWILLNILSDKELYSKYAKAYISGQSIKSNARFHQRQTIVVKLDVENFFEHISQKTVFLMFKNLGYSNKMSLLFSNICTLETGGIAQGAITSPAISNIIMKSFDEWLGALCLQHSLRYTRYADDITISGDFNLFDKTNISVIELIKRISRKLKNEKLTLNKEKTRILTHNSRQVVTGISVNQELNVNIKYRKNLRLELYHFLSNHSEKHLQMYFKTTKVAEDQRQYYVKYLIGRINYVLFINDKNKEFFKKAREQLLEM